MASRPCAIIFRTRVLRWAETFIAAQAAAMTRYEPLFVGVWRDPSGIAMLGGMRVQLLEDHHAFPGLAKALLTISRRPPRRWIRAIAATRPQVVHAHFGSSTALADTVARALGIPLLVTYHGTDATVVPKSVAQFERRRRAFAAADRIIAVSAFVAEALTRAGCPEGKITTHHTGVDTARFSPGRATREAAEVLFVGRLVEVKGVTHLIRAMEVVRRSVRDAHLIIAGDGPLREGLRREAAERGVPAQFLGIQTPEQVVRLMRRAAVFCGPSIADARGNAEGLGMTLLEAQACALPVVATTSGGIVECVVPGETGLLSAPGDERALAANLQLLLEDPALRARLGTAAQLHVERNFDLVRQTVRLEAIYDELARRFSH